MPAAIPEGAAAHLPPARMIDPRGHRFGAGVLGRSSLRHRVRDRRAVARRGRCCCRSGRARRSVCATRSTAAIWRRIVRAAGLGNGASRSTSTRRGSPRCSAAIALDRSSLASFAVGADDARLALRAGRRRAPDAARGDRLLPRLPALLPALVGARSRHPDLDPRPRPARRRSSPSRSSTARPAHRAVDTGRSR